MAASGASSVPPPWQLAYYELFHARARLGQSDAQLRALEQAVEYEPASVAAHRNLAALYMRLGQQQKAQAFHARGARRAVAPSAVKRPLS